MHPKKLQEARSDTANGTWSLPFQTHWKRLVLRRKPFWLTMVSQLWTLWTFAPRIFATCLKCMRRCLFCIWQRVPSLAYLSTSSDVVHLHTTFLRLKAYGSSQKLTQCARSCRRRFVAYTTRWQVVNTEIIVYLYINTTILVRTETHSRTHPCLQLLQIY